MKKKYITNFMREIFPKKQGHHQNGSISVFSQILLIVLIFLSSCKKTIDDSLQIPSKTDDTKTQTIYPLTDKVGFGTDLATGEAGSVGTIKGMVINIKALYDDWPNRVLIDNVSGQSVEVLAAEDAYSYTKSKSGKLKVSSGFGLFKSSISYFDSLSYRSDLIYSSYTLYIKQNRIHLNASSELLKKYLSREFLADVNDPGISPADLVSHYGTAIVLDEITGGRFTALYRSKTENSDKRSAATAGLSAAIKTWFDLDISGGQNKSAASTNTEQQLYYTTSGGYSSIPLIGEISLGNTVPNQIKLAAWQSSVLPANSIFIDFGSSEGAISLADVIPDPVRAATVRAYINQYYLSNEVKMIDPPSIVYGYYDSVNGDWGFSIKNEPTMDGRLLRSAPAFRAYAKKIDGTVAIYQFYSAGLGDYMYSADQSKMPAGYSNMGIAFYAYDKASKATVSVFEFLYHAKINKREYYSHFYSTTNQLPGTRDWAYTGLPFYAYPL